MNVMTVGEIPADVMIKIQPNEEASAQDFASELDRASGKDVNAAGNAQQTRKTDDKTQPKDASETKKTEEDGEEEPEEPKKVHAMNSVPVVLSEAQAVLPEDAQAAVQAVPIQANGNEDVNGTQTALLQTPSQGEVHNAAQAAMPNEAAQYMPATAMQNPKAQEAVQKAAAEHGMQQGEQIAAEAQTGGPGNTAVQNTSAVLDEAQAFAAQALREIADLTKAQAGQAQTAVPAAEQDTQAMQPVQTADNMRGQSIGQPVQEPEQPAVQNTQQQDLQQTQQNTLIADVQTDNAADQQTADGESKHSAKDGNVKNPGMAQIQTTAGATVSKVEFQQAVQATEQPAVRQSVMTTIIDTITTAFGKETTEMTVQLRPEHLGGLSISLSMGESGLVAKMVTSEHAVQQMIHGEIGMLQDVLREKGIPVVHMEVSYGQTMNSSTNNQGGNGGSWTTPSFTGSGAAYDNTEEPVNYYYNMSSYDVLAEQGGSVEFSA